MTIEYTVIRYDTLDQLITEVNLMLQAGWQPQGGITLCEESHNYKRFPQMHYAQALIRSNDRTE